MNINAPFDYAKLSPWLCSCRSLWLEVIFTGFVNTYFSRSILEQSYSSLPYVSCLSPCSIASPTGNPSEPRVKRVIIYIESKKGIVLYLKLFNEWYIYQESCSNSSPSPRYLSDRLAGVLGHLAETVAAGPAHGVQHHDGHGHDGHPDGVDDDTLGRQRGIHVGPAHRMRPTLVNSSKLRNVRWKLSR